MLLVHVRNCMSKMLDGGRMKISTTMIVLLGGVALAQSALSLPDAAARLPRTLEWRAADGNFETARRALETAQAGAGLKVNAGADYSNSSVLTGNGQNGQTLKLTATASVSVLPWSPAFDDVRRQERNLEKATLDRRDARQTLLVNLNTQYFAVRSAQVDVDLNRNTVALREAQARATAAQRANGQATRDQELTAQQNLESARLTLAQAENTLEISRLTLAQTLDLPSVTSVSTEPTSPRALTETLDAALKRALTRRSDVLKAQINLRDAEDTVSVAARARWFPNASVNLGVNGTDAGVSTGLNLQTGALSVTGNTQTSSAAANGPAGTTLTLSASLNLPLIAPSSDAQIGAAQTNLVNAQAALERSRKSAELDVRQKYADLQNALKRIELNQRAVQNTQSALQTAEARLKAGSATKIDADTARLNLQTSRKDLETAIVNALLADLKWRNALGEELTGQR
jgi:outer membrane protein